MSFATKAKVKRVYFTKEDDLYLAREVLGQNPYEDWERWNLIKINLLQITGKNFQIRTLKERIQNLINKFESRDKKMLYKSGIEEEVDELDDLIRQITGIICEFKKEPKRQKKGASSYEKGYMQRENATKSFATVKEDNGTIKNANLKNNETFENLNLENNEEHFTDNSICDVQEVEVCSSSNNNNGNETTQLTSTRPLSQRNILTPTRKRNTTGIKNATLTFLTKKSDLFYEIRSRELAIKERKLILEEKSMS